MPYDTFNTYGGAAAMHEDTATTKAAPSEGQSGGLIARFASWS